MIIYSQQEKESSEEEKLWGRKEYHEGTYGQRKVDKVVLPSREDSRRMRRNRFKKRGIMTYVVFTILSCFLLQVVYFTPLLPTRPGLYLQLASIPNIIMCLWSYYKTVTTPSTVRRTKLIPKHYQIQNTKFTDYSYSLYSKACGQCKIYKYPRVSHCRKCGDCVYKLDHHCLWTQNCIGYCNQRCFYLFCFYMTGGVAIFWYYSLTVMKMYKRHNIWEVMPTMAVLLWIFTCISALFVGIMIVMLFAGHTIMIMTNYTSLDTFKTGQPFPFPFFNTRLNLYDRGEVQNLKEFFGVNKGRWNWIFWWMPIERQINNQFFAEGMNPHPIQDELIQQTNVYEVEKKYKQYMEELVPKVKTIFKGKKMKFLGSIYEVQMEQGQKQVKLEFINQ